MNIHAKEQKLIKFSGFGVVFISGFLIAACIFGLWNFRQIQDDEARQYLEEVTEQYKTIVEKQIEGDLQTLKALSTFVEQYHDFDAEDILTNLKIENEKNDFMRMGYVRLDGKGFFVDEGGTEYRDIDVGGEKFIQEAMEGKAAVSDTIKDRFADGYINCYGVPIYKEGILWGVLTATNKSNTFANIIDSKVFRGKGFLHMIQDNGDYVIRSQHKLVRDDIKNIFYVDLISKEEQIDIQEQMKKRNTYFSSFSYENKDHWMSFTPLSVNDWYLFCVVPQDELNGNMMRLLKTWGIVLGVVAILFAVLFLCIYHIIKVSRNSMINLVYYDPVTGGYNKNRFRMEAMELLSISTEYALVVIDIANFKFINELFGYENGDKLLKHVADVCKNQIGKQELYYRENADKFGLLLLYDSQEKLIERIHSIMRSAGTWRMEGNQRYNIICNCGVKVIEAYSHKIDLELFFDRANMALAEAKGNHENTIAFYDDRLHAKAKERNEIENQMYTALRNQEFKVCIQPKITLQTGAVHSGEALVRWIRADGKTVYPDKFIPVFEQNGFITKLDLYMLERVCQNLRCWIDKGYSVVPISVNQSRLIFYQNDYLDSLQIITQRYSIDPSLIILEVTEGITIENIEEMKLVIQKLHQMGFTVSMDDFGSGYSSLNILQELSIDELKLDKVFLADTKEVEKRNLIMKNIIHLSEELRILTVVEGVETEDQAAFVKSIHCDVGQGYYYSRPMSVEDFEHLAYNS